LTKIFLLQVSQQTP